MKNLDKSVSNMKSTARLPDRQATNFYKMLKVLQNVINNHHCDENGGVATTW